MEHVEQPEAQNACDICGMVPLAPLLRGRTHLIAQSEAMQDVLKRAARFAESDAPVVVLGETGSGKEVVARLIHANSTRREQAFVAVNVAALPAELLESELFGHAKGAFTGAGAGRRGLFEAASKGTLFLDEIGEMPLSLQVKLLRALQDGEVRRVGETEPFAVDVRVICATHRDLRRLVQEGKFREDLYYRLKVLALTVPPLRERKGDVAPLARHFLAEEKGQARTFSVSTVQLLEGYRWPGNVRELQNAIKHGAALATRDEIDADDLPDEVREGVNASASPPMLPLAIMERQYILRVVDACGGSQAEAARVLGIGRNTLWRKLRAPS